jgi:FixJ family two-component response regulator
VDVACNTDFVKKGNTDFVKKGNTDFVCVEVLSRGRSRRATTRQRRGNDEATMSAAVEAGGQG